MKSTALKNACSEKITEKGKVCGKNSKKFKNIFKEIKS